MSAPLRPVTSGLLRRLAGTRLMLAGCAWLGGALAFAGPLESMAWPVITAPLLFLGVNLAAAIATSRALRRGGLAVFHVALLALMIVAGVGRLLHLDARVEITQGGAFDPAQLDVHGRGPLHPDGLARIAFVQGPYTTEYAPGVKRGHTRSEITLAANASQPGSTRVVGDDDPLDIDGYLFYTTHNKGFAPIVTWTAHGAAPQTGALHMPSYPLFEHRQQLDWTPPGGTPLRIWLVTQTPLDGAAAWTLDPAHTASRLVVHADGQRSELAPGEEVRLAQGVLRYERLAGWMGYRVFYDPTLRWLLVLAATAAIGLAWHLAARLGRRRLAATRLGLEASP